MAEGFRERQARVSAASKEKRSQKLDAKGDSTRQKLIDDAKDALRDGEIVEDVTTGIMNTSRMGMTQKRRGSLIVTDRRVVFFSKKIGGHESHEFAYHMILSLDTKRGVAWGSIHLHAAGDQIEIQQVDKGDIDRVTESIRAHMNSSSVAAQPAVMAAAPDLADQLRKLADLRDQDILTDEEFAAQKAKLLA